MKLLHYLLIAIACYFLQSCEKGNMVNPDDTEKSDPFIPILEVNNDVIHSTKDGGTFRVMIKRNISYRVKCDTWIEPDARYSSSSTLFINVNESHITSTRQGCITIYNDQYNLSCDIVIVQEGWNEQLVPNENKIIYTSTDNSCLYLFDSGGDSSYLRSHFKVNSYDDGKGVMIFDIPITYLPDYFAFGDRKLETITLPNTVVEIGKSCFLYCDNLKAFYSNNAFSDNRCLVIKGELVAIAPAGLTSFTVPNSVSTIRGQTFHGCSTLKRIAIPNSVFAIGEWAFYDVEGILEIDSSILGIDHTPSNSREWLRSSRFSEIIIGDNVSSLGNYVFAGYESLEKLTIGKAVKRIGSDVFWGIALKTVYCKPNTPPQGVNSMFNTRFDTKIYVPTESVEAYKTAKYWSAYADYIEGKDF